MLIARAFPASAVRVESNERLVQNGNRFRFDRAHCKCRSAAKVWALNYAVSFHWNVAR